MSLSDTAYVLFFSRKSCTAQGHPYFLQEDKIL